MIGIIGWIGNIAFLLGAIFLAIKWRIGWHMQIIGNASYVVYSILIGVDGLSLLCLSILLIIINIIGLKKWRKTEWIKIDQ